MNETPPPSFYGPSGNDQEPTTAFGPVPGFPTAEQPAQQTPPPAPRKPRGRAGFAAAVVTASLLVGAGAGVGGAAAYDAWNSDGTGPTSSAPTRTSQVVDQGSAPAESGSVQDVASTVLPSVVKIDVTSSSGSGSGSGIILSEDGTILTNNHVVEGAEGGTLTVSFSDGTRAEATVLGTDPLTDTAVIKAEDVSGLTPATIGQSDNLAVGQGVVAIGSPFGLDATVTSGIVSALARPVNVGADGEGNTTTYPAIQTDAAINPGNSGGPLVDMTGSVIGINSSIRTASGAVQQEAGSIGLGFAIPIDEVMPIVDQMIAGETPTHARLGIQVTDASVPQGAQPGENVQPTDEVGARVREITDGATAGEAGLEAGDVITKVDDELVDSADDLVATIRSYRPGDKVTVTYTRDGETSTAELTLDSDAGESGS